MNQHWYHCLTCRMVDGVGVCSVCAKVCQRAHDVTYSKFGSFFCDCGATDDRSCQALVRRPSQPDRRSSHCPRDSESARGLHHTITDQSLLKQLGFEGAAAIWLTFLITGN
jgi:hypothetical protein